MHRIDGPGATADNRFTDGDPVGGVQATMVTDDWANAIQEEIISVISDPAVVPAIPLNKAANNQLVAAIKKLIAAGAADATTTIKGISRFGTSPEQLAGVLTTVMSNPAGVLALITAWFPKRTFAASDYIRIPDVPGGLIFQWASGVSATVVGGGSAAQDVNFPITFPNGVVAVIPTAKYVSGAAMVAFESPTGLTTSKASLTVGNPTGVSGTAIPRALCIGY